MDELLRILLQILAACIQQLAANAVDLRDAMAQAWVEAMRGLGESIAAGFGDLMVCAGVLAAILVITLLVCASTMVAATRRSPPPVERAAGSSE